MIIREFKRACFVALGLAAGMYLGVLLSACTSHAGELKQWKIEAIHDGTRHVACSAQRALSSTAIVTVTMLKDMQSAQITLEGVDFGVGDVATPQYSLWQIDDNDPEDVYTRAVTRWKTAFTLDLPPSKNLFLQFRNGRKLNVLVGNSKFSLDLVETSAMVSALQTCNAEGQRKLNRKRMSEARLAATRSA